MNKETTTETLKLKYKLEQGIETLRGTLIKPLPAKSTTHSAHKAKETCEAINTATADLRNVLYSMFLNSGNKNDSGEQS
ncbi:MAG: hypothetical protein J1F33_05535 [Clostridiales bacterium]|nr:hypothetical protein [Clostridiales bacterium]